MKLVSKILSGMFLGFGMLLLVTACGKSNETNGSATPTPVPTVGIEATPTPTPAISEQGVNLFTRSCTSPTTCYAAGNKEFKVQFYYVEGGYYVDLSFSGAVKTDATGRLKVGLPYAGKYLISPMPATAGTPAQEVTVSASAYLNVTFTY